MRVEQVGSLRILLNTAKPSHMLPVIFVLHAAPDADLVSPVAPGIGDREPKLVLAFEEQPKQSGQHMSWAKATFSRLRGQLPVIGAAGPTV